MASCELPKRNWVRAPPGSTRFRLRVRRRSRQGGQRQLLRSLRQMIVGARSATTLIASTKGSSAACVSGSSSSKGLIA